MATTINLEGATPEQIAYWITFKDKGRTVLSVITAAGSELHIIYTTGSGFVGVIRIDDKGVCITTEFYSSYDPSSNTYSGYITQRKNLDYDKK